MVHYFIRLVGGSFHLLVDPAFELIRITEELLQVEGIGQLGPAVHCSLMEGISAAEELKDRDHGILQFILPKRWPAQLNCNQYLRKGTCTL